MTPKRSKLPSPPPVLFVAACLGIDCAVFSGDEAEQVGVLVLRHQLAVRGGQARPEFRHADRASLAAIAVLPRTGWPTFLVKPETLLGWRAGSSPIAGRMASAGDRLANASRAAETKAVFEALVDLFGFGDLKGFKYAEIKAKLPRYDELRVAESDLRSGAVYTGPYEGYSDAELVEVVDDQLLKLPWEAVHEP